MVHKNNAFAFKKKTPVLTFYKMLSTTNILEKKKIKSFKHFNFSKKLFISDRCPQVRKDLQKYLYQFYLYLGISQKLMYSST